jgi:hypothetical protein
MVISSQKYGGPDPQLELMELFYSAFLYVANNQVTYVGNHLTYPPRILNFM